MAMGSSATADIHITREVGNIREITNSLANKLTLELFNKETQKKWDSGVNASRYRKWLKQTYDLCNKLANVPF